MRVPLAVVSGQGYLGRHRLQPVQIPRISMALSSDQRRGQSQSQRQVPQYGRHLSRPYLIVQAGPSGQKRQRLIGTENVRHDRGRVRGRMPGADDQNLRCTSGRDKRRQRLRVGHIVEHQQATVAVGLQQVPHRLARIGDSPPGTVLGQFHGLGHRGQSGLQAIGVRGVDPGHQPPAGRQLRPCVRGRQLCRPPALQPGRRVNHRYASTSAVQPGEHVGPRLEARRLQRDITHHDLMTHHLRCRRLLGLRPGRVRMPIADGQVMAGRIDVPFGAHILLNAVNGLFHHPLPRPR